MISKSRILIAEDDPSVRALLIESLQSSYHLTVVSDGSALEEKLAFGKFDLVISDLNMPYLPNQMAPDEPVQFSVGNCGIFFGTRPTLVITGFAANHPQVIQAREMPNVHEVLFKPVKIKYLLSRIQEVLQAGHNGRYEQLGS